MGSYAFHKFKIKNIKLNSKNNYLFLKNTLKGNYFIFYIKTRNNLFTALCVTNLYIFLIFIIAILRGAVYKSMININNLQKRKDAL